MNSKWLYFHWELSRKTVPKYEFGRKFVKKKKKMIPVSKIY